MRQYETDDARSAGPPLVWRGPEGAPVLLVVDPGGEAKHDELPATWRPLAEHLRIGWCRLPAEVGDSPRPEDALDDLDGRATHVHLVASGAAAEHALRLALSHVELVRTVVVVDPAPPRGSRHGTDTADMAIDWWDQETFELRQQLVDHGVRVRCFVSRERDPAVRVERPVPLGHPDVVGRLVETLLSFERMPRGDERPDEPVRVEAVEPERRAEVAEAWRIVREHVAGPLERARRDEK